MSEAATGGLRGKWPFLLISAAVVAVDQWTKWLVEIHLPEHVYHPLIPGVLLLSHVTNTGVAFGAFASGGTRASLALVAVGLLALGVVGAFFWRTPRGEPLLLSALGLVLGGALGNLVDRVAAGAVTDFIAVFIGSYHWPDFNVADSAISIGLGLLVLDALRPARARRPPAEEKVA